MSNEGWKSELKLLTSGNPFVCLFAYLFIGAGIDSGYLCMLSSLPLSQIPSSGNIKGQVRFCLSRLLKDAICLGIE